MTKARNFMALDVGERRIGVAVADDSVRIPVPLDTIEVDGNEAEAITQAAIQQNADTLVVGYPRNQSGESTKQTSFVEEFVAKLDVDAEIVWQDESLTSVLAEERLKAQGKPYSKGDIDAQAAAIILQDYMETHFGY